MTDFSSRLASLTAEPSRDTAADPSRLARVEKTRSEMLTQGDAIRKSLQANQSAIQSLAEQLQRRDVSRIVIAGCGDSWFIGTGVRYALERLIGVPVEAAQALDYASYGVEAADAGTVIIGISASGTTPVIVSALEKARAKGAFTIGLSNTPGSSLVSIFDAGLIVDATRKGWPTQSTTAAMAVIVSLGCAWAEKLDRKSQAAAISAQHEQLPALVDATVAELDAQVEALSQRIAMAGLMLFAGLGPNYASAAIGAAKIKELSPIHAYAMPLEEYHHYRSQKAGDVLVLIATDEASSERALDTALVAEDVGGFLISVLSQPNAEIEARSQATFMLPQVPAELTAFISVLPLHLLAYHFAKARSEAGLGAVVTMEA